jgi:hypothetical protein
MAFMIIPPVACTKSQQHMASIVWVKNLDSRKFGFFKLYKYYASGLLNPKKKEKSWTW